MYIVSYGHAHNISRSCSSPGLYRCHKLLLELLNSVRAQVLVCLPFKPVQCPPQLKEAERTLISRRQLT